MKTILRRKDNTSIFCPSLEKRHVSSSAKSKVIEGCIGCTLLAVGLFLLLFF